MNKKFKTDWSSAFKKMKDQNGGKKNFTDDRIYKPEFDDNGTARTIMRFLPSKDTDVPFVEVFSHYFGDVGGWFIDNCPTTLGKDCPVCKENSRIWDDDPDTVRKRKKSFYSNVLIIDDKKNPANNGKIFLFKYGVKIQEKIMELINDDGVMPFDYYEGANFDLKVKKVKVGRNEMPNYDSSTFKDPSSVGTDDEIEKLDGGLYPLAPFIAEDKFKSIADLEEKLFRVIGQAKTSTPAPTPPPAPKTESAPVEEDTSDFTETTSDSDDVFGEEEDDEFFNDIENG